MCLLLAVFVPQNAGDTWNHIPARHLPGEAVQLVLFVECRCVALRECDAQRLVLDRPLVRLHGIFVGLRNGAMRFCRFYANPSQKNPLHNALIYRRVTNWYFWNRGGGALPLTAYNTLRTGVTPCFGQVFESQVGVTCMQGQGICKDRSKICNELSTASIELMDVE